MIKEKLELIEWEDSYTSGDMDWRFVSETKTPKDIVCSSVGWVIRETKSVILIVPHITDIKNKDSLGCGCGGMTIPKSAIIKRKELKT